ncbi:MAG: flagellar biosynthesis protein FlhA [Rhizobiales bacterium]|nr:flagellar biosynthesis protein FlhA [Hyphomicrobiales bacterium]
MSNTNTAPNEDSSGGNQDVYFAAGILVILSVLFLPMPTWLVDFGLAFSIAFSVLILMVALWIKKPLDFSSFPTILLIATMIRLALNISTTRLILSNGQTGPEAAGGVISGFANFVMGGDFVIGVIVFIILVTVNFIVITKGASRIAEVGARFTLDAIPGKQMAIDADLAAGLLNDKEAQTRRLELEEESSFYGSMDGASKFVRGDAIAGLIITAVNIVGGIVIGAFRHDMAIGEAADIYTRLSVGDGLVSQIPALIVSLASGLLVSKVGTRESTEKAIFGQMLNYPKALYLSASLLAFLSLTPGMPFVPFMGLALILSGTAYMIPKRRAEAAAKIKLEESTKAQEVIATKEDSIQTSMEIPEIELVLGKQLSARLIGDRGEMGYRVSRMRKKFATAYGFIIPEIKLTDSLSIASNSYEIKVYGTTVASAKMSLTEVMVVSSGKEPPMHIPFVEYTEPAYGAKAWLFPDIHKQELTQLGFQPIDTLSQVLTHVSEVVKNNLSQLFSYKDMRIIIDGLDKEYARLVEEIVPTHLTFSGLQAVFKMLLADRISVRNVKQLLEAIAEVAPYSKRGEQIVEHVRTRMAQQICGDLVQDGKLKLLRLGTKWDQAFSDALVKDARGEIAEFNMSAKDLEEFGKQAKETINKHVADRQQFGLTTSPEARKYVRMIIERIFPTMQVLSNLEIARGMDVQVIGSIGE